MRVNIVSWTGTLYPAYYAAKTCTKQDTKRISELEMEMWLQERVINPGHMSILEFIDFHFIVRGISRACSHQLVRHRLASYAQQSQRAVSGAEFGYVIPPKIRANEYLCERYKTYMRTIGAQYQRMVDAGIPQEDARFILPNAATTTINVKMNARALIEASRERLCGKAQWEIREMFLRMQDAISDCCPLVAGNMVAKCRYLGHCPEDKSCRRLVVNG